MNLSDIKTVKKVLAENGFAFKKSLGQNFIVDPSVCPAMAAASADENTGVLEIGPGIGVLTAECAAVAKRVVAIELDERLKPVLKKTLSDFSNIEIIFGDALKIDLNAIINKYFCDCSRVVVCANIPYYVTSPLIIKLLESKLCIDTLTVMVQKEAAVRLCAGVGTRDAGAISVYVNYFSEPKILFDVPKTSFVPVPDVDSAVIQLKLRKSPPVAVKNEQGFFNFVKACFAQRRKTFLNSVSNTLRVDKEELRNALASLGIDTAVRSEMLSLEQLSAVYDMLDLP